ncbi:MAG: hypothetical protein AAGK14_05350 [Verrucomicrobiota bacterium]
MDGQNKRSWWQPRTLRRETATVILCQVLFWGLMLAPIRPDPSSPEDSPRTVGEAQMGALLSLPQYFSERYSGILWSLRGGDWGTLFNLVISPLLMSVNLLLFGFVALQLSWLWVAPRARRWLWDGYGLPCLGLFLVYSNAYFIQASFPIGSIYDLLLILLFLALLLAVALGALVFGHLGRLLLKPRGQPQPSPPKS